MTGGILGCWRLFINGILPQLFNTPDYPMVWRSRQAIKRASRHLFLYSVNVASGGYANQAPSLNLVVESIRVLKSVR